MSLEHYISRQFSNPIGIGGRVISFVMNRQNRPLYKETIRLLAISNTDRILDIGCGNGHVMSLLASQNNCILTGIDSSASVIRDASRRCQRFVKSGQLTLLCENVNAMSFPDNSFSKAYTINTVYFWENLNDTLSDIRRVLTPNGLFINTLYSNETLDHFTHTKFGYKRFTVEQLTFAGHDAGFTVNVIPILDGTVYCIVYQRTD